MNTHTLIIQSLRRAETKSFQGNGWGKRHVDAWTLPKGPEKPIRDLILALVDYAEEYEHRYGSKVGDDGFLGPEWARMIRAVRAFLNGETGRFDCGTLDGLLLDLAALHGITEDDL